MTRGRPTDGSRMADKLQIEDPKLRERTRHILATLCGEETLLQAAEAIGVTEEAFRRLRWRALEGMVDGIVPRKSGRVPMAIDADDQNDLVAALRDENNKMRVELECLQLREELAVVMPQVLDEGRRGKKNGQGQGRKMSRRKMPR